MATTGATLCAKWPVGDLLRLKWRIGDAVRSYQVDGRLPYGSKAAERVARELKVSKREVERCYRFAREHSKQDVEELIRSGVTWSSMRNATGGAQFKTGDLREVAPSDGSKPVRGVESWDSAA